MKFLCHHYNKKGHYANACPSYNLGKDYWHVQFLEGTDKDYLLSEEDLGKDLEDPE